MSIEELKIAYYHEALALSQRALISGIVVSAVAYSMEIPETVKTNHIVPFFNIELASERNFALALVALFFILGLVCNYGIDKANNIRKRIIDTQTAELLLESPNIIYSNLYIRSILYGALFGAGAILIKNLTELDSWAISLAGSILACPYFLALYSSNPDNRLRLNRATSSTDQ